MSAGRVMAKDTLAAGVSLAEDRYTAVVWHTRPCLDLPPLPARLP
ncbi:MAG: hypothetical protein ACREKS_24435 [Candidatus Rokuibacteriota bacterium]